jgi:type VI secretion system protein ImpF
MADQTITERLQPSLLDRLTDNAPTVQKETREERVIDIKRLRDIIQRDLSWLLNTTDNRNIIDAKKYPYASKSVINYGLGEVSGQYTNQKRAEMIRDSIREAIIKYEPRIHAGSIDVQLRAEQAKREFVITFDIIADMWAQPMPLELYLRSEVDVTTGHLDLTRMN